MEWTDYLRFVLALAFVLGLIGLAAWLAKRYGLAGTVAMKARRSGERLAVEEVLALDARRRLVLIRRDDTRHLLLLGQDGDLVVERDVPPAAAARLAPSREDMP